MMPVSPYPARFHALAQLIESKVAPSEGLGDVLAGLITLGAVTYVACWLFSR